MIKLGSKAIDSVTGIKGTVMLFQYNLGGVLWYLLQPKGVNKETGLLFPSIWVNPYRLTDTTIVDEPDLPIEILGTQVEDVPTGFKGTAIGLILHMSGCLHVDIQPRGQLKTGGPLPTMDTDIRRLKGRAITAMTERKKAQDKLEYPSPSSNVAPCHGPH